MNLSISQMGTTEMKFSKSLGIVAACLAAWLSVAATWAETLNIKTSEGMLRMKVDISPAPIFPPSLIQDGITEGQVTVLVVVDEDGDLKDWLVTEASHFLLVKAIDRVIEDWDFEAPTLNGEFILSVNRLDIEFDGSGGLVDFSGVHASVNLMLGNKLKGFNTYGVASVTELDSIPEPIYVERPVFPRELLGNRNEIRAILDFYIDEEGDVHIPTVRAADDGCHEGLLVAAQNALWEWKFSPPTIRGKPVVARAAQPFVFQAVTLTSK